MSTNLPFLPLSQQSMILLCSHHSTTDMPHVYIPSTMMETFIILQYLSLSARNYHLCMCTGASIIAYMHLTDKHHDVFHF